MAFLKLLLKSIHVISHSLIELFFSNIYIVNFNIKILTGRE